MSVNPIDRRGMLASGAAVLGLTLLRKSEASGANRLSQWEVAQLSEAYAKQRRKRRRELEQSNLFAEHVDSSFSRDVRVLLELYTDPDNGEAFRTENLDGSNLHILNTTLPKNFVKALRERNLSNGKTEYQEVLEKPYEIEDPFKVN